MKPESRNRKPAAQSWDTFAIIIVAGVCSNNQERTDIKAPGYNVPYMYVTAVDINNTHPQTAKAESFAENALKDVLNCSLTLCNTEQYHSLTNSHG